MKKIITQIWEIIKTNAIWLLLGVIAIVIIDRAFIKNYTYNETLNRLEGLVSLTIDSEGVVADEKAYFTYREAVNKFQAENIVSHNRYTLLERVGYTLLNVAQSLIYFILSIFAILNIPKFRQLFIGKNDEYEVKERIAMYPMFGMVFIGICILLIAT